MAIGVTISDRELMAIRRDAMALYHTWQDFRRHLDDLPSSTTTDAAQALAHYMGPLVDSLFQQIEALVARNATP